jgi:dethiobiotin synthetase
MSTRLDCFVTGTDTGVGKTWVSAGLMRSLAAAGLHVAGMKPVASGCRRTRTGLRNADAEQLQALASITPPYELVNPVRLAEAVAPHIAAARAGVRIDPEAIWAAYQELRRQANAVVVEGIGGWRVPLAETGTTADLVRLLDLPVLLVVGLRLGCINHALLSVESITADRIPLAGWVANHVDPRFTDSSEVINYLSEHIAAPLIGTVPNLEELQPDRVAEALAIDLLAFG